jgi:DNA-damage-inducible protein J
LHACEGLAKNNRFGLGIKSQILENMWRGGILFRHFSSPKKLDHALQMPHIIAMKTAAVHSRIEPETKEMAEGILRKLGLSPTDAIRLFYTQITLRNGLPFPVAIPNEETAQAMVDSRKNRNLSTYSSTDELFKSWDE